MKLKPCIILSFLLGFHGYLFSQEEIRFNHLNAEDGFTSNAITCIFQDSYRYVWVGTAGGLSRYDGNSAVNYVHKENDSTSISNSRIDCIYEDNLHMIWVGTYFGLSRYNPVKKNFTNYYFDKWSSSMESSVVSNIMQDNKGMMWVATGTGIYKANPANPQFTLVKSISEDHYGWLIHGLVNTTGGRIFMLMDTALLYTDDYGQSFKTAVNYNLSGKNYFSSLYYDSKKSDLWFGVYHNCEVYDFNTKTFEIKKYSIDTSGKNFSNYMVNDFCRLNDSIMLAGCLFGGGEKMHGGLIFLNTERNTYQVCSHDKGNPTSLSTQNVNCIIKDRQNTFWIGTNLGVNSFNLRQLNFHWISAENCKVPGLASFTVTQMCYDKNIWIGTTGSGLIEYKSADHSFSWYPATVSGPDSKHRNALFSMYPYKDTLWLGVGRGFIRFNIEKHVYDTATIAQPDLSVLYSNATRGLGMDNEGVFWFGTYNKGLFNYNPATGKGSHYLGRDTNLISKYRDYIKCMNVDVMGNKWIGTYTDGFYRIDAGTNKINWNMPGDKKEAVMQRVTINDIFCDETGKTYIATEGDGLLLYDAKTKTFDTIRNNKWAEDNKIKKIVESKKEVLWLATGKGLSCWDLNKHTFRIYPEGMPLASMINIAGCASSDSTVYFGGDDEILYFNPGKLIEESPSVNPEITSVSVMNKEYHYDITQPLFLSYRDNIVSFTFSAFDFLNEKGDQFAYRLEGFDKDWNYCGNRHFAEYTNLPGGTYALRLKVETNDGVWAEADRPLIIHITTPYWKTWWFVSLCGLAAFALGYLFFYLKIQRKLEAERLRARLARDLHDDIGSSLSSISILSDMAVKNSTSEETQFIFSKISESSHKTMESMKDIVWTVNPENDEMESLLTRMHIYCSEILEPLGMNYSFKIGEGVEHIKLPMDIRRNFYLVFKEAINNIAKYARSTEVNISILKPDGKIEMKITDNGIGFNVPNSSDKGNGLKNMNERAKLLNGNLSIISKEKEGTTIALLVPYT